MGPNLICDEDTALAIDPDFVHAQHHRKDDL